MSKKLNLNGTINIHKEAGAKKDAIRINAASDIPDFLKSTIKIVDNRVLMDNVEAGTEECPLGLVIGYEKSERTPSGYNCWCITNAATNLIEIDGVFYKKATVMKAIKIPAEDQQPEWMKECNVSYSEDGSTASYECPWATVTGKVGTDYFILYGYNDGKPDANILSTTEKSFRDYIVCDDAENDIGYLWELDQQ